MASPIIVTVAAPAGYFGATAGSAPLFAQLPNPPAFYSIKLVDGVTGALSATGGTPDGTYEVEFDYNEFLTWGVGVNGPNLHVVQQPLSSTISNADTPLIHRMFSFTVVNNTVVGQRDLRVMGTNVPTVATISQTASSTSVTANTSLPSMGLSSSAAPVVTLPYLYTEAGVQITTEGGTPLVADGYILSYPLIGNGTYDAAFTFSVDRNPTASPWLASLALFAVPTGNPTGLDPRLSTVGLCARCTVGVDTQRCCAYISR